MDYSPPSSLTEFQHQILEGFFQREKRMFLTGGGALAGFYLGHRRTDDLDLFAEPSALRLDEASAALRDAATAIGATVETVITYADFHRHLLRRGSEQCVVDLVIDRVPALDAQKRAFGPVRVDTLREIAANKICAIIGRSQIRDLVDLRRLVTDDAGLRRTLDDAQKKDASADPATLAYVVDQIAIGPDAALPDGSNARELETFRQELVKTLRSDAFAVARKRGDSHSD